MRKSNKKHRRFNFSTMFLMFIHKTTHYTESLTLNSMLTFFAPFHPILFFKLTLTCLYPRSFKSKSAMTSYRSSKSPYDYLRQITKSFVLHISHKKIKAPPKTYGDAYKL